MSRNGPNIIMREIVTSVEREAERLMAEMLKATDWTEQDLREHSKGDRRKVRIAATDHSGLEMDRGEALHGSLAHRG